MTSADLVDDLLNPQMRADTPNMVMRRQAAEEIKRLRVKIIELENITEHELVKALVEGFGP